MPTETKHIELRFFVKNNELIIGIKVDGKLVKLR